MTDHVLLAAARAAVDTWDDLGIAPSGSGILWDAYLDAMRTLADVVTRYPPTCHRCGSGITPEQINVNGRHLVCALQDDTFRPRCRTCMDGLLLLTRPCAACGGTRAATGQ